MNLETRFNLRGAPHVSTIVGNIPVNADGIATLLEQLNCYMTRSAELEHKLGKMMPGNDPSKYTGEYKPKYRLELSKTELATFRAAVYDLHKTQLRDPQVFMRVQQALKKGESCFGVTVELEGDTLDFARTALSRYINKRYPDRELASYLLGRLSYYY